MTFSVPLRNTAIMAFFAVVTTILTSCRAQEVGDVICTGGYIMDSFCIDRVTLFDNPGVVTLEGPDQHSVHCLVDVSPCVGSRFEVLQDPMTSGELYGRWYRVDDNTILTDLAREVGTGGCSTCGSDGYISEGFRAEVVGTITTAAEGEIPPIISVSGARVLEKTADACGGVYLSNSDTNWTAILVEDTDNPFKTADGDPNASPTVSPNASPVTSPTAGPNASPTVSPNASPTSEPTSGTTHFKILSSAAIWMILAIGSLFA